MSKEVKELARIAGSMETLAAGPSSRPTDRPDRKERFPLMGRLTLAIGGRPKKVARGVSVRRSNAITAYVGPNGGGKSLALVLDTLPTMRGIRWECDNPSHVHTQRGQTEGWRGILSTVALLELRDRVDEELATFSRWERPRHPRYEAFRDFGQLLEAEHCDILMDEVVGIASSRESARMDPRIQNILVQLRRRDCVLRWTAPNWARADKILREVTQAVVECRGYFAGSPLVSSSDSSGAALWAPKRVFKFSTFDAIDFEEWTAGKRDQTDPLNSHWFKGPGSDAFRAYDTLDAVSMVEQLSPDNICLHCGKRQREEYCKGHSHDGDRRASTVGSLALASL